MKAEGWFDVREYGAKGDGKSNDRDCIQAALNAARDLRGGTVFVPAGTYLIQSEEKKGNDRDEERSPESSCSTGFGALLSVYSGTNVVGVSSKASKIIAEENCGLFVIADRASHFAFRALFLVARGGHVWQSPGGCSQGTVEDVRAEMYGAKSCIWFQEHRQYIPERDDHFETHLKVVNNPGWVQMRVLHSEFSSFGKSKNVAAWYIATSGGLNANLFAQCRFNDNPVDPKTDPKNSGTGQYAVHLERCHPSAHAFDNAFRDLVFEQTTGGELKLLSAKNCIIENCHGYDYSLNGYHATDSEDGGKDNGKRFIFADLIAIGCGE